MDGYAVNRDLMNYFGGLHIARDDVGSYLKVSA
jgi:hypothetical protein